jgi:hypothetical protein
MSRYARLGSRRTTAAAPRNTVCLVSLNVEQVIAEIDEVLNSAEQLAKENETDIAATRMDAALDRLAPSGSAYHRTAVEGSES